MQRRIFCLWIRHVFQGFANFLSRKVLYISMDVILNIRRTHGCKFVTWHQQKVKSFFMSYKHQGVTKEIHDLLFSVISLILIHLKQLVKATVCCKNKRKAFHTKFRALQWWFEEAIPTVRKSVCICIYFYINTIEQQ